MGPLDRVTASFAPTTSAAIRPSGRRLTEYARKDSLDLRSASPTDLLGCHELTRAIIASALPLGVARAAAESPPMLTEKNATLGSLREHEEGVAATSGAQR